jgi:hypothetical protein
LCLRSFSERVPGGAACLSRAPLGFEAAARPGG